MKKMTVDEWIAAPDGTKAKWVSVRGATQQIIERYVKTYEGWKVTHKWQYGKLTKVPVPYLVPVLTGRISPHFLKYLRFEEECALPPPPADIPVEPIEKSKVLDPADWRLLTTMEMPETKRPYAGLNTPGFFPEQWEAFMWSAFLEWRRTQREMPACFVHGAMDVVMRYRRMSFDYKAHVFVRCKICAEATNTLDVAPKIP